MNAQTRAALAGARHVPGAVWWLTVLAAAQRYGLVSLAYDADIRARARERALYVATGVEDP